jgi:3-dehydroquinate dehydratase
MSRGKRSVGAGEIDAIKAFIVGMVVLTIAFTIYTFFFVRPRVDELERINRVAKVDCERIQKICAKNKSLLDAYQKAKDGGGIASPEEYFARMRDVSSLPGFDVIDTRRETGKSRDYKEYYTSIGLKNINWDQVVRFMYNVETGPKYRILEFDARRAAKKGADVGDNWKLTLKAAYRTQPEPEG